MIPAFSVQTGSGDAIATTTALVEAQDATGGWGFRAGAPANTESTALAVLALGHAADSDNEARRARGVEWLRSRQRQDGSWPMSDVVPEGSWMSALAVLALEHAVPGDAQALRGAAWLAARRNGRPGRWHRFMSWLLGARSMVDQDPRLVGWPWSAGTSAWVEPTAWALLALRTLRTRMPGAAPADRIRQGELLLADRMCRGGGWNYGNRSVLGEDLPPYPDTTALALIALQDGAPDDVTQPSLDRLVSMMERTPSTLVLALGTICLELHGRDASASRAALRARLSRIAPGADTRTLAFAAMALHPGARAFSVDRNA